MARISREPIPLRWIDDAADFHQQMAGEQPPEAKEEQGTATKKRASTDGDKNTATNEGKRRKVTFRGNASDGTSNKNSNSNEMSTSSSSCGHHNSCTDDEESRKKSEESGENDDNIQVLHDTTNMSTPGHPMAQSTPMASASSGSSSTRSAFSVLQQPMFGSLHPSQLHFFPTPPPPSSSGHGGYFFPPSPMEAPFHPLFATPYNNFSWMRGWPPVPGMGGFSQPGPGFFGMKMEPSDFVLNNESRQMGAAMNNNTPSSSAACDGEKKKANTSNNKTPKKGNAHDGEQQRCPDGAKKRQQNGDSGMGKDETTLSTEHGGSSAFEPVTLPIPPPAFFPGMHHPINGYETYCTVPGRLTLLSNMRKYRVSIAEIQRRLAPPESLNASILGGILRKAKSKDGGRLLREQLLTYGVDLPTGRRKQGSLTCFSSLVEEEAVQLARDFRTLCHNSYPVDAASAFVLTDVNNAQDASMARLELFYANKFLNRILDFHKADQSPNAEQPKREPEQFVVFNPEWQSGLTNYSLLTHGFGGHAMQSMLESMISVVNESNAALNRNYQETAGQMATPLPMASNF